MHPRAPMSLETLVLPPLLPLLPSLGSSLLLYSLGKIPTNFRPPSDPETLLKSGDATWTLSQPTRFRLRPFSPVLEAMACSLAPVTPYLAVDREVLVLTEVLGAVMVSFRLWVRPLEPDLIRLALALVLWVGVAAVAEVVPVEDSPERQTTTNSCLPGM